MPLVYQQNINGNTKIGVWHITESESFFLNEIVIQKQISHPHKRLQHLAGRYLLKSLNPDFPVADIKIISSGKPYLENDNYQFSISHAGDFAAVIISEKFKVGIDMEMPGEKIEKIKTKFTGDKEISLFSNTDFSLGQKLTAIWSMKEAMFKWYGLGLVDFRENLLIEALHQQDDVFIADCCIQKKGLVKIQCVTRFIGENILTYAM